MLGYPAQAVVYVAADGVNFSGADRCAKELFHILCGYSGINQHCAVRLVNHLGVPGTGELVLYLADDLLQQILHGDEALGAAIFIHHDGDLGPALLQLFQQVVDPFGLGNDERFTNQSTKGVPGLGVRCDRRLCQRIKHIAGVDDTKYLIDRLFIDREPAMARAHHRLGHNI